MITVPAVGARPVRADGPISSHLDGFQEELIRLGFTPLSARGQMQLAAHLSMSMKKAGLSLDDLDAMWVDGYLRLRRDTMSAFHSPRALSHLLGWLADRGLISPAAALAVPVPEDETVAAFRSYMLNERRLAVSTAAANTARIKRFMDRHAKSGGAGGITAQAVAQAMLEEAASRGPSSVQKLRYTLRSFLRFCFLTGVTGHDLSGATLAVKVPVPSPLPFGATTEQVRALLASCDPGSAVGRRDLAVLCLICVLGLRAGEVAGLTLEDFDWRHAEVLDHGKGGKSERLPLPDQVGSAMTAYLANGRPASRARAAFLRTRAPIRPLTREAVSSVVARACGRAGIEPFRAHRLRHTLGERMIQEGVPLDAISQVLRHSSLATTANYARVDVARLRSVAQAWPGQGATP
ncbi:MAG: tyrosine-type recombinase/integrase [Bifidobacteriaceae bacterium]|jgi:site-specific recombinase XerD|nr:tyrosine-type recombinase/integrase [Bifidobacteriaceae bacterium]